MQALNLPPFDYKIQRAATGPRIFDIVRKKYVPLTPEEWVRQHFLHYLVGPLSYPRSLCQIEHEIKYNQRQHRPDIVVYDQAVRPLVLVECKAPHIAFDQEVVDQLVRYNTYLQASILVITNGIQHFCWRWDRATGQHIRLPHIPRFPTLTLSD